MQKFPKFIITYGLFFLICRYCRQNFLLTNNKINFHGHPVQEEVGAPESMTIDFRMLTVKVRRTCVPSSLTSPPPPPAGGCSNASTTEPCTILNETKAIKITVRKYRRLAHLITIFAKGRRWIHANTSLAPLYVSNSLNGRGWGSWVGAKVISLAACKALCGLDCPLFLLTVSIEECRFRIECRVGQESQV